MDVVATLCIAPLDELEAAFFGAFVTRRFFDLPDRPLLHPRSCARANAQACILSCGAELATGESSHTHSEMMRAVLCVRDLPCYFAFGAACQMTWRLALLLHRSLEQVLGILSVLLCWRRIYAT